MAGVLWTGIDIFLALVLGPVIGGLDVEKRAAVFQRLTPKSAFLLPMLANVTIFGGITLAVRMGYFPHSDVWIAIWSAVTFLPILLIIGWQFDAFRDRRWQAAFGLVTLANAAYLYMTLPDFAMTRPIILMILGVMTILSVMGFGILMPGEIRMYLQMRSENPDKEVISEIGMRNAKLGGVQAVFQFIIIVLMVYLRWGGF
jgi:hypothetical protein